MTEAPPPADEFDVRVNGVTHRVRGVAPTTTLLEYLRDIGLTGTKRGCDEGDCGACTVAMLDRDGRGETTFRSFCSCITPLPADAGRTLVTVEGVAGHGVERGKGACDERKAAGAHTRGGDAKGSAAGPRGADADGDRSLRRSLALHPVQRTMVEQGGSQCGFCTPGFIVSMFEGFYRRDLEGRPALGEQLAGNLCRCTGYRPIRDAFEASLAEREAHANDAFARLLVAGEAPPASLRYRSGGERFFRPTTVDELLALLAAEPDARLVAGATELGVDHNKKRHELPCLVSTEGVAELRRIVARDDEWSIGGAVTLTSAQEALGGEFPLFDKMMSVFASRQIRNRATLAGNLVTASPIGDCAPVLLALDASLDLRSAAGTRRVALEDFFTGYRQTRLASGEIVAAIVVPRRPRSRVNVRADSYKVSKRRELDISIVAAAFSVEHDDDGVVRRARLAYGGVAATPLRAKRAEAALIGARLGAPLPAAVRAALAEDCTPIGDARGGAPFRAGLVASLLEKFLLGVSSESLDAPLSYVADDGFAASQPPPLAGRDLRHESAANHVTGAARYVDDAAQRRPMLEIWPVCSPHPHARVLRIETAAALACPGVVAVLTAADVPGLNDVGALHRDEPLLAETRVDFVGHPVALVVGDSYDVCRRAADLVEVSYEPLAPVLTIDQAVAEGSFHTKPHRIARGDCDAAFARAPHRVTGRLTIGGQEHFYLETHAAYAEPGDDGDVHVVSSTQHPSEVQAVVAHVLDVPRHDVVVTSPRMGGGFGGKETQGNAWASLVALAAVKTGRAVRVMLDRDLDMQLTGKRHPFRADYEVAFDGEGRLLALRAALVSDGGWSLDLSGSILDRALFHIDNGYYVPNVDVTGRVAKTNLASNTAFRGFGGPQGMVVIEEAIDHVARTLGMRPEVVREKNLYREGERATTHYGQAVENNRLPRVWAEVCEAAELPRRLDEIACFNAASEWVKRGIAVTPVKFGISFTASFLNQAGALVHVYRDGSVQVHQGGTEMGQGLYTKMLGVAVRELGVPPGRVRVMATATDKVANTSATAASSGADLNGAAVRDACVTLRSRLAPVASKLIRDRFGLDTEPASLRFADGRVGPPGDDAHGVPFDHVISEAYVSQVNLTAQGFYRTPGLHYDRARGQGRPFHYFAFGAAACEVEVDGLSGMKRLRRVDIVHDVGDSLNPGVDRGQIEGGFVQGAGWLTGEELIWRADGTLATHSASTYQIPAIGDAPADFRVKLLRDAPQPDTIHGSKAVGEPPLMLAMCVREALRDAVAAFGAGGPVDLACPATHEAIFHAVRGQLAKRR